MDTTNYLYSSQGSKPFESGRFWQGMGLGAAGLLGVGTVMFSLIVSFSPLGDKLGAFGSFIQNHQAYVIAGESVLTAVALTSLGVGTWKVTRSMRESRSTEDLIKIGGILYDEPEKTEIEAIFYGPKDQKKQKWEEYHQHHRQTHRRTYPLQQLNIGNTTLGEDAQLIYVYPHEISGRSGRGELTQHALENKFQVESVGQEKKKCLVINISDPQMIATTVTDKVLMVHVIQKDKTEKVFLLLRTKEMNAVKEDFKYITMYRSGEDIGKRLIVPLQDADSST